MEDKTIINELDWLKGRVINSISAIQTDVRNETKRKSEKTGKMYCRDPCTFKALYATRKYGCSGLKDKTECLECPFRR